MSTSEERRSERISVELPVVWHRGDFRVDLTALDVNLHGMFLRTSATVPVGSLLQLSILLPEEEAAITVFVTARFVGRSVSGTGIGAEMYLMAPFEMERWNRFYQAERKRHGMKPTAPLTSSTMRRPAPREPARAIALTD